MARARYLDINEAFLAIKIMNERLEKEIQTYRNYYDVLTDFLRKKGITEYPKLNLDEFSSPGREEGGTP